MRYLYDVKLWDRIETGVEFLIFVAQFDDSGNHQTGPQRFSTSIILHSISCHHLTLVTI